MRSIGELRQRPILSIDLRQRHRRRWSILSHTLQRRTNPEVGFARRRYDDRRGWFWYVVFVHCVDLICGVVAVVVIRIRNVDIATATVVRIRNVDIATAAVVLLTVLRVIRRMALPVQILCRRESVGLAVCIGREIGVGLTVCVGLAVWIGREIDSRGITATSSTATVGTTDHVIH